MNCSSSVGVENAVCAGGDTTSCPISTPRISTISGVSLDAGRMPPCPGLAPCDNLISIIFTFGSAARFANSLSLNSPCRSRQLK